MHLCIGPWALSILLRMQGWDCRSCEHEERERDLPYFILRKSDVPQHWMTPSAMMAIRSPSVSASSMKWVDRSMVRPDRLRSRRSHRWCRAFGSNPDDGSSRMTTWMNQWIQSINQSIHQLINSSIDHWVDQSIHPPINPSLIAISIFYTT